MQFQFSIDAAIAGNDLRQAAAVARQVRAEGVVIAARGGGVDLTALSSTGAREVRRVLASADVQLVALRHALGPDGLSPRADLDRAVETLESILRGAAELGRPMVCVDLGPLPPAAEPAAPPPPPRPTAEQAGLILLPTPGEAPPPSPSTPPPPRDPQFEASVDAVLREVGRSADRYGVVVAFSSSLAPIASLHRSVSAAGCPWFGVDLDPLAVLADEEDRDAVLSRVGPLVRHARARDGVRGAGNRVRAVELGQGQVDVPRLLRDLDQAGYHGFVTVDARELSLAGEALTAAVSRAIGLLRSASAR